MTSRRPALLLASAILALAGTACEDLTGLGDDIIIENESGVSITQVFIRDCDSSNWGSDRLGAEEVIAPNESRGFNVGEGCYDLRADFLSGGQAIENDVDVAADQQFVWTIDSPSGTIVVENNATVSVHFFYLAQCTDGGWGEDELGTATIAPGAGRSFPVLTGCWDRRAVFSDASSAEEADVVIGDDEEFTWELTD